MNIVKFINKVITHNRDEEGDFGIRVLIHILPGMLMGIPVLGWGLIALSVYYQKNEYKHHTDQAWKYVYGYMIGYAITTIGLIIAYFIIW